MSKLSNAEPAPALFGERARFVADADDVAPDFRRVAGAAGFELLGKTDNPNALFFLTKLRDCHRLPLMPAFPQFRR